MSQLLLLRHGKSSWDDPDMVDRARPLNRRGERAAAAMGRAMSQIGLTPGLILTSPARRCMQTLAALAPFSPETKIESPEGLYLAEAPTLFDTLRAVPETERSVLVIGHNPGLHEFAVALAGEHPASADSRKLAARFPTAALAEFRITGKWRDLAPGGGRLVRFLLPRDLPEMAA